MGAPPPARATLGGRPFQGVGEPSTSATAAGGAGASWRRHHRPSPPPAPHHSQRTVPLAALSTASWDGLRGAFRPPGPAVRVDLLDRGVASEEAASSSQAPPQPTSSTTSTSAIQPRRRVRAEVRVAARPDTVWAVLTDFEALPSIVPNLEACERVRVAVPIRAPSTQAPPRLRLRQRASAQCRFWRLEAEAVLELEARGPSGPLGVRELAFSLVEGDFRELAGRWVVAPLPGPTPSDPPVSCLLRYEVDLVPRWPVPQAVVAAVVAAGLPANVGAIAAAAEAAEAESAALPGLAAAGVGSADTMPLPSPPAGPWEEEEEDGGDGASAAAASTGLPPLVSMPGKGPPRLQAAPWPTVRLQAAALGRAVGLGAQRVTQPGEGASTASSRLGASDYLGVSSVPLPAGGGGTAAASAAASPSAASATDAAGVISVDPGALASADLAAAQERRAAAARVASLYPAFGGTTTAPAPSASSTSQAGWRPPTVHMRRLDTAAGGLHRRAVAEVWVAAPPADVWAVLTDYERLPDIVPGLVASDVLSIGGVNGVGGGPSSSSSSSSSPPTVTRLRQVGYKRMTYVELHAEAVLDVVARVRDDESGGSTSSSSSSPSSEPSRELQFRAVAGDFDLLRGKFMVEPGNTGGEEDEDGVDGGSSSDGPSASTTTAPPTTTLLRYAVEVRAARASPVLGLLEPWLEAVVVEDVPAALGAVGRAAEARAAGRALAAAGESSSGEDEEGDDDDDDDRLDAAAAAAAAARIAERWRRPRLADMAEDFAVLAAELDRCFGGGGGAGATNSTGRIRRPLTPTMPGRAALRAAGRSDLEKAIAAHGGSGAVAARLGWAPVQVKGRKPNGYWDDDATVAAEVAAFIAEHGLPPGTMPPRSELIRAARWDIARAAERRGGLYALAQAIGLDMPTRASTSEWAAHVSAVAAATGLSGTNGLFERAAATYRGSVAVEDSVSSAAAAAAAAEESEEAEGARARTPADSVKAADTEGGTSSSKSTSASPASKAAPAAPRGLRDEIDAW